MGDKINSLPFDEDVDVPETDMDMINVLFKPVKKESSYMCDIKQVLVASVLFLCFSSKTFDKMVRTFNISNETYVVLLKMVAFAIIFFLLKNRF